LAIVFAELAIDPSEIGRLNLSSLVTVFDMLDSTDGQQALNAPPVLGSAGAGESRSLLQVGETGPASGLGVTEAFYPGDEFGGSVASPVVGCVEYCLFSIQFPKSQFSCYRHRSLLAQFRGSPLTPRIGITENQAMPCQWIRNAQVAKGGEGALQTQCITFSRWLQRF
jgi:hypothetical protein